MQALKLDPDNDGAFYYLNLIKQARYGREALQHTVDTQARMVQVEKAWVQPTPRIALPVPNPYRRDQSDFTPASVVKSFTANSTASGWKRFPADGLPLSEVIRQLSEQAKLRDPDKKGINFLFNPNADTSAAAAATAPAVRTAGRRAPASR